MDTLAGAEAERKSWGDIVFGQNPPRATLLKDKDLWKDFLKRLRERRNRGRRGYGRIGGTGCYRCYKLHFTDGFCMFQGATKLLQGATKALHRVRSAELEFLKRSADLQ